MKKILASLLSIILIFSITACGLDFSEKSALIPNDFKVFNIKLGGMNQEQFEKALKEAVEGYTINVTFDGVTFPLSGADIDMKFNDAYDLSDAVSRIKSGELTAKMIESNLFTLGDDATIKIGMLESYSAYLEYLLQDMNYVKESAEKKQEETTAANAEDQTSATETNESEEAVVNPFYVGLVPTDAEIKTLQDKIDNVFDKTMAKIEYDENNKLFIAKDGVAGDTRDYDNATQELKIAVQSMKETASINAANIYSNGEKALDSIEIQNALAKANKYFDLVISYTFNVPDSDPVEEIIDSSNIINFLYISASKRIVRIHKDQITSFANELATKYGKIETSDADNEEGKVVTTKVGTAPDANKIYEDILVCFEKQESGAFTAEYIEINESSISDYGSLYVYVDLDAQKVSLIENDKVILEAPCVSGGVSAGHSTPDGVFSIYYKQRNATLRGPGYASFVKYWMPFNGGIGLHDADGWRYSYGGDIYLYNGSHGCINLPEKAAAQIYEKVQAGTKVVVVGGKQSTYRAVDTPVASTQATTAAPETTTAPSSVAPTMPSTQVAPSTMVPTSGGGSETGAQPTGESDFNPDK